MSAAEQNLRPHSAAEKSEKFTSPSPALPAADDWSHPLRQRWMDTRTERGTLLLKTSLTALLAPGAVLLIGNPGTVARYLVAGAGLSFYLCVCLRLWISEADVRLLAGELTGTPIEALSRRTRRVGRTSECLFLLGVALTGVALFL